MKISEKFAKFLYSTVVVLLSLALVIKLAGPRILKMYITYGIGDCAAIPILCLQPESTILTPEINSTLELIPQTFPKMSVSVPRGFALVQELIKKTYYKRKNLNDRAVIYLLIQEPGAFIKLYPDVKKQGITDNREFIRRLMYANLDKIDGLTDAFFIVMKSIFIPDIGNQETAKMIRFKIGNKDGYINYTTSNTDNYYDCNVLDNKGNYFKVYIKDIRGRLDLNDVFAIISTLKPVN